MLAMAKPLKVAGEVDSFCTKCRMILNHRIISMKNGKPYQVECLTCHGSHLYRPNPPGERPAAGEKSGTSSPRPSRIPTATRAEQARLSREQTWEKAIAGRGMSDFKAYSIAATFNEGDLVRHKKFGDGVITRVVDAHKVEVMFRDETRTLAHGTPA
jgi:hypothetical protein